MHVRVASAKVQQGKMQELIDIYNNSIVPSFKTLKGFKSAYLMTDVGSYTALSVTVWESEAVLTEAEASSTYQEIVAAASHILGGPIDSDTYELSVEASV